MSESKAMEIAIRAVGLLPDVIRALAAGGDEESVRQALRDNRERMAASFDDAEARIRAVKDDEEKP